MAYGKWIGLWLGSLTGGVLGAIAGFVLGSMVDGLFDSGNEGEQTQHSDRRQYANDNQTSGEGARNGFLFSLMVLSAHVIQADGKIMHSEMEMVRSFLRNSFGAAAEQQGNNILLKLFEYRKRIGDTQWRQDMLQACHEMRMAMPEEQLIQLVAFLAEIVKADGSVKESEVQVLRNITRALGLTDNIVDQMLSLGGTTLDEAYKVLGISPQATDDEVRQAYKSLVRKHHPDRVAKLGEDVRQAAEKKMQAINEAKERIYKERGL